MSASSQTSAPQGSSAPVPAGSYRRTADGTATAQLQASSMSPMPPSRTVKPSAAGHSSSGVKPAGGPVAASSTSQTRELAVPSQPAAPLEADSKARKPPLPLPLLGGLAGCAGLAAGLVALLLARRRRRGGRKGSARGGAAAGQGPCSKLKPTAKCVPLADGSGCVIRREIPADNSCLFNSVGYVMHKSKTRAPHLRNVVARQVAGDRATYSDAFLGMTNEAYCSWIRQPYNWGGGIELAILAQAYSMEIAAWNIESCKEHVFGEESGYKRQAMVIYNGVHYDALAVAASPRANPEDDETSFNPRTKRGKMILAAARKLTELAHRESAFHGTAKKHVPAAATAASATTAPATTATAAASSSSSSATHNGASKSTANSGTSGSDAAADGSGTAKPARPVTVPRRVPRAAAAAGGSASVPTSGDNATAVGAATAAAAKLSCGDCGEVLCGGAAAAEHAKATGHQNYVEVAA